MFRWNAGIYMDDKVRAKPNRYRRIVERKRAVGLCCYCITLPANEGNCMDIYTSREFWFRHYQSKRLEIIGLAASRAGALDLVCQITEDVMERFGEVNARSVQAYFSHTR